jgi:hypothetical protein
MAELLIKAVDATHSDPAKDSRGCYKRGDPVVAMPDGHSWGVREGLPKFVLLKVPGVTVAQAQQYIAPWTRAFTFTVVSSNLATDTHAMTIAVSAGVASGGAGGITREQVEAFLNNWNATVNSAAANSVNFTCVILNAIRSAGFWNRDVSALSFTEVSYTQATGNHRVRADYPAAMTAAQVEDAVRVRGGVITSHNTGARRITFDITRATVRSHFEATVIARLGSAWNRRRFRLTDAEVSAIESAGGVVTRTPAQVQAALRDRQTE